ncbi:glycerol-3-phosphate acyltransferase [Quercus suber]|uniref:Glycerol-3-phosphate acyltransferase, chloroplastic n=1 Tax=Quercus suber TaxID=58331 RepID=A0AAW0LVX3_QUESU
MFILSSSPLTTTFFTSTTTATTTPKARVSFSFSVRFCTRRQPFPSLFHSFKASATAEMLQDKESSSSSSPAPPPAATTSSGDTSKDSRTFLNATTEQELLAGITKEREAGRLPSSVASGMEELADEIVLSNMAIAFDRMFYDVEDPFVFEPFHEALREPFDYYMFGQNYIRPLVDYRNSYVGNISLFYEMEEKLQQGHNIVLMSNHQTEADPAIIALLLEATNPRIAENMTYVAGDRVLIDPLCKPFSIGRNLICVYSKKHLTDIPELVEMKRKANTRSLKEMALRLRGGSQLIWIAPSGGRDRPYPHTEDWYPAPFDTSSVDNMRRLVEHSGTPGHIYPMALLCHNIMPPPPQVEKEIGEKRVISFHGVGLSVSPGISFSDIATACENPEEAKDLYTQAVYNVVMEQYNVLKSAIHAKQGLEASTPSVSLSQPWN